MILTWSENTENHIHLVGRECVITQAEKGAPGTGPSIWALKTNKNKKLKASLVAQ